MTVGTRDTKSAIIYLALASAGGISFLLPEQLTVSSTWASPPPKLILRTVVHDFKESHPDFDLIPVEGYGHYAGNIGPQLGPDQEPQFIGLGSIAAADVLGGTPITPYEGPFGYDTPFSNHISGIKKTQIATQINLPAPITVSAITAYVGMKDKKVCYAIYQESGGAPGALVAETVAIESSKDSMEWLTIPLAFPAPLEPGTYWLALALEDDEHHYASTPGGGTTHFKDHDAVGDGFLSSWVGSTGTSAEQVAIYANFTADPPDEDKFGEPMVFNIPVDSVKEKQIATRVDLPEAGTLLSITSFVGNKDRDVRYAIYSDQSGEPGTLIAETFPEETPKTMGWVTLYVPDTPLTAGTYWLALSMEDNDHTIATAASGGAMRIVSHKAYEEGFLNSWGTSETSTNERFSIFGTYTNDTGPVSYNGFKVTSQWRDAQSRPIAPQLAGVGSDQAIDFDIVDQAVIPEDAFAVEVRVLGAAIQTGSDGYHRPVTMQVNVGGTVFEPFGPFTDAVLGNLNDDQTVTCNSNGSNPRCAVVGTAFPAGTAVHVDGRSWGRIDNDADGCLASNWESNMEASTTDNDVQLRVLRNGDPVPDIDALYEQDSIDDYVGDYIDLDTNLMTMDENQVIYLFELGGSGSSSSADFQDLVVLVTLAADATGLCGGSGGGGTSLCGQSFGDTDGAAIPAGDIDASGGISSAATFAQWFNTTMGTNFAMVNLMTLVDNGSGVYEFLTNDFHPIDNRGFGNEGYAHNHFFTCSLAASFTYTSCGGQFIEFEGDDDAWLFVDDQLVMDLGGMLPGTSQIVEMDRFGLIDGAQVEVRFFYAQRQSGSADFNLRTNIPLVGLNQVTVSEQFD